MAQSRPRDAATGQHAGNDADDAESDEPDAAQSFTAPTHRPWRPGAQTGAGQPDHNISVHGGSGPDGPRQHDTDQEWAGPSHADQPNSGTSGAGGQDFRQSGAATQDQGRQEGHAPCNWPAFCDFCSSWQGAGRDMPRQHLLRSVSATWADGILRLAPKAETQLFQLERGREELTAALAAYGAGQTQLELVAPRPYRPEAELIEEFSQRPELQPCLEVLNARVKACRPLDQDNR